MLENTNSCSNAFKRFSLARCHASFDCLLCVAAVDGWSPNFRITVSVTNKNGQTYIQFLPPLMIHNCLMCDLEIAVKDSMGEQISQRNVLCSRHEIVHGIDLQAKDFIMLTTKGGYSGTLSHEGTRWPNAVRLTNSDGERLVVAIDVSEVCPGSICLTIFVSYWILDHTDLALQFAQHGSYDNICVKGVKPHMSMSEAEASPRDPPSMNSHASDDGSESAVSSYNYSSMDDSFDAINASSLSDESLIGQTTMHMFTFSPSVPSQDADAKIPKLLTARISGGAWAEPWEIKPETSQRPIELLVSQHHISRYQIQCSVKSAPGMFHRTKVVTVAPRFYLTNHTEKSLLIKDTNTLPKLVEGGKVTEIEKGASKPFHWSTLFVTGQGTNLRRKSNSTKEPLQKSFP